MAQFHKACKHNILLSTEQSCSEETGSQPTFHKVDAVATGAPSFFAQQRKCLAAFSFFLRVLRILFPKALLKPVTPGFTTTWKDPYLTLPFFWEMSFRHFSL